MSPDGSRPEVDLPRKQYKAVSNYLLRTDREIVPFAPAGRVADEMRRLVTELASEQLALRHPVVHPA